MIKAKINTINTINSQNIEFECSVSELVEIVQKLHPNYIVSTPHSHPGITINPYKSPSDATPKYDPYSGVSSVGATITVNNIDATPITEKVINGINVYASYI